VGVVYACIERDLNPQSKNIRISDRVAENNKNKKVDVGSQTVVLV
jgi:hypothetical protein